MLRSKLTDVIVSAHVNNFKIGRSGKTVIKITPHHVAGNLSVEAIGKIFQDPNRKASSHYGIGSDGRVGSYVTEDNTPYTSSSVDNDSQAITIEVANIGKSPNWEVSDQALNKLVDLCVDICQRYNIKAINYTGDKTGNLTRHNMFSATSCPGAYLQSKFPWIQTEVNRRLGAVAPTPPKPVAPTPLKSIDVIAREVIAGKWNVGAERVRLLTNAGYNASQVQARVNEILKPPTKVTPPSNTLDQVARDVIHGKYGNEPGRSANLRKAGYDPVAVQKRVNEMLKR